MSDNDGDTESYNDAGWLRRIAPARMWSMSTFGWETLAPKNGGRQLKSTDGRYSVAANVRTGGKTAGLLYLDLQDTESGWVILVLDRNRREVARGEGRRKQDAWEKCEQQLERLGLLRLGLRGAPTGRVGGARCRQTDFCVLSKMLRGLAMSIVSIWAWVTPRSSKPGRMRSRMWRWCQFGRVWASC
jgi:hypothetical protein